MFGITDFPTYVLGAFLIILLPGPNSLFVLATAARRGVRTAYWAACGVFLGDTVLMALSAAGVASLLRAHPVAFAVVKYAGAGYLAWIGIGMLRAAWRHWRSRRAPAERPAAPPPAASVTAAAEPVTAAAEPRPFRRALVVSLLNPKAILFFISFFIQFVDPAYPRPALSFLILGGVIQVFSVLYLSALIFSGTYLAGQFRRRRRLAAALTTGAGALFFGFGAKLAMTSLS